jgi:hypothetical protein
MNTERKEASNDAMQAFTHFLLGKSDLTQNDKEEIEKFGQEQFYRRLAADIENKEKLGVKFDLLNL